MDDLATIIFMAVLVIFSAYFSATETAFSTLNRARVKADADRGDKRAADVLRGALKQRVARAVALLVVHFF